MFGSAPWIPTALAVVLAMIAALCFAYGAFLQQLAVVDAISDLDGPGATRHEVVPGLVELEVAVPRLRPAAW